MLSFSQKLKLVNDYRKSAPVDVTGLIPKLGLVYSEDSLNDNISGMIEKKGDTYKITVNAGHPLTRKRFTAAHELGHYFLHLDKLGDSIVDNIAYRATEQYQNIRIGQREETQANQFAANLLMPQALIETLQKQNGTEPEKLAERLGVSVQAMKIRLGIKS